MTAPNEPGRQPADTWQYPAQSGRQQVEAQAQPAGLAPRSRPMVDASRLWAGGFATAVVAGLVALVGVLASRWLFAIPILAPKQDGAYGDATTTALVLIAAAIALLATGLVHLLVLSTPRPLAFFGWIFGLATVLVVLLTFRTGAPLPQKAATAVVYLILAVAIGSLVSGVAERSVSGGNGQIAAYPPGR